MRTANRTWLGLVLGVLALFITACGSSNDINQISGQQGPPGQPSPYVGDYLGAANLGGGQTSVLSLDVANNGVATGTVTVTGLQAQTAAPVGTYDVQGSVDLTTGAFTVNGNVPAVGPFSITGTLPATATGQGHYTLTVGNQTFHGVIQDASQGTPQPPSDDNEDDATRHLINGGEMTLNFVAGDGYNGHIPDPATGQLAGAVVTNSSDANIAMIALLNPTLVDNEPVINGITLGIITRNGEQLEVGKTYPFTALEGTTALMAGGRLNQTATPDLSHLDGITSLQSNPNWVVVPGQSEGTATITELTSDSISLEFEFSNIVPNPEVPGNTAAGSFSANGSVTAHFAPVVQQ
jgi:hypothetical protein